MRMLLPDDDGDTAGGNGAVITGSAGASDGTADGERSGTINGSGNGAPPVFIRA